ncbi:hypothetical protein BDA96_05G224400 [Sorghum bicolor]|uniref:PGG domain-containing protein n=1 Tax=Sorghum bicolor TaxID=4558 RepID=A0A921R1S4_SORBI|nr:hypothetical protein BDA96_05G224400 [Sorghum bicolor]
MDHRLIQHQQHIQLAPMAVAHLQVPHPHRRRRNNDGPCFTSMCPFLHGMVYIGETTVVMEMLPKQVAAADCIYKHGQCSIHEVTAAGRNTVLHVAAAQGHHELIRELYLRFRDHQGLLSRRNLALDTPLHSAARAGHAAAVKMLAELARDCGESILGCKNEAWDTALHLAARHGHDAAVKALVLEAAELNNAGVSAMYLAVISGSLEAVRAITTCRGASSAGPSSQNALHAAVFHSTEMVELLLEWNPELADQVDCDGSTPLHLASSDGDPTTVRALLRAATPPRTTMYRKDSGGLSALHVAARMGHGGIVADMLRSCLDAMEVRDDAGRTFLHTAARENRRSVVSVAIKIKNTLQRDDLLDAQDRDGNTPLHLAVAAGAHSVVKDLLCKGKVRTNVLNKDGHTALDLAAGSTNFFTMVSLVVTLVAYGAQLRPQRQDHLKPWIETTGQAILARRVTFKWFLCLDTVAAASSVVAVVLLVYGKASRSAGSWRSFVLALHCMWVSLVSLFLAFYAALTAVVSARAAYFYGFLAIYVAVYFLTIFIVKWIGPRTGLRTVWRFLRQYKRFKAPHVIRRKYPLAGAIVLNLILFSVTSLSAYVGVVIIVATSYSEARVRLPTSPAPAPAPSPLSL